MHTTLQCYPINIYYISNTSIMIYHLTKKKQIYIYIYIYYIKKKKKIYIYIYIYIYESI